MFYRGKFFTKKEVLNCCYCCTETECIFESKYDLRDLFWSVQYSEESRENFSQTRLESLRSIVRVMLIKCQVGTFLIWIWLWSAADGCLASPLIVLLADECIEAFEELWLTVFLDFSRYLSQTRLHVSYLQWERAEKTTKKMLFSLGNFDDTFATGAHNRISSRGNLMTSRSFQLSRRWFSVNFRLAGRTMRIRGAVTEIFDAS